MYHRFSKPTASGSGKWQQLPHSGLAKLQRISEGKWQIDVTRRQLGNAIRREVYSVTIRREMPFHEEFLSGFSSKQAALAAARKRIDLLQYSSPRIRIHRSHRRPKDQ